MGEQQPQQLAGEDDLHPNKKLVGVPMPVQSPDAQAPGLGGAAAGAGGAQNGAAAVASVPSAAAAAAQQQSNNGSGGPPTPHLSPPMPKSLRPRAGVKSPAQPPSQRNAQAGSQKQQQQQQLKKPVLVPSAAAAKPKTSSAEPVLNLNLSIDTSARSHYTVAHTGASQTSAYVENQTQHTQEPKNDSEWGLETRGKSVQTS